MIMKPKSRHSRPEEFTLSPTMGSARWIVVSLRITLFTMYLAKSIMHQYRLDLRLYSSRCTNVDVSNPFKPSMPSTTVI